jgi:hypothetical protein
MGVGESTKPHIQCYARKHLHGHIIPPNRARAPARNRAQHATPLLEDVEPCRSNCAASSTSHTGMQQAAGSQNSTAQTFAVLPAYRPVNHVA